MTRTQFQQLPWCDQEMYTEAVFEQFADPEAEWEPEMSDPDGPVAPDISILAGANVVYAQFGGSE